MACSAQVISGAELSAGCLPDIRAPRKVPPKKAQPRPPAVRFVARQPLVPSVGRSACPRRARRPRLPGSGNRFIPRGARSNRKRSPGSCRRCRRHADRGSLVGLVLPESRRSATNRFPQHGRGSLAHRAAGGTPTWPNRQGDLRKNRFGAKGSNRSQPSEASVHGAPARLHG